MLSSSRTTLTTIATVSALAAGGAALAGAATSSKPSSSSQRAAQTALTGDTADKVKAAALDRAPGATVLRVEAGGPSGSKYHAHVRKSDGTEVVVLVDIRILGGFVFWPVSADALARLTGTFPFPTSDHRVVAIDLTIAP